MYLYGLGQYNLLGSAKGGNNYHSHQGYKRLPASVNESHPVVSNSATPWTVACQAPLSMGFSRQEYWSGLLFPTLGESS